MSWHEEMVCHVEGQVLLRLRCKGGDFPQIEIEYRGVDYDYEWALLARYTDIKSFDALIRELQEARVAAFGRKE